MMSQLPLQGILPVNKPKGKVAFSLVSRLRHLLGIKKIGHAGTLDPFATGVMVMLIGREATRLSDQFLQSEKEYRGRIRLGITTETYDCDGRWMVQSNTVPSQEQVETAIAKFQGEIEQVPPMFSAKKVKGKKLYELARQGKVVERLPVRVQVKTELLRYEYPFVDIAVTCSKGTYIRSIANDLGDILGCGGHLEELLRVRSGNFHLSNCYDGNTLFGDNVDIDELRAALS